MSRLEIPRLALLARDDTRQKEEPHMKSSLGLFFTRGACHTGSTRSSFALSDDFIGSGWCVG